MKTVSVISIIYGTFAFLWATLVVFAIGLQKSLIENVTFPEEALQFVDIPLMLETLHGIMSVLVPFIFLIGLIYIISGILGLTEKPQAYLFGMLAAVFNIVWYVSYIVILQLDLVPLFKFDEILPSNFFNLLFLLGTVVNAIFYCAYPVFLIIFLSQRKREA
jgi:hypothetical protein